MRKTEKKKLFWKIFSIFYGKYIPSKKTQGNGLGSKISSEIFAQFC